MVMGLAIQTVMAPLNLLENPLLKALFFSKGGGGALRVEDRIFEEKVLAELTPDDEVVDPQGNPVVRRGDGAAAGTTTTTTTTAEQQKSLEDVLLDTWDGGSKANVGPLLAALTKKNANYQTKEDHWTALMILAGLGATDTPSAIRQVLNDLGANPAVTDKEGWNAFHWAAFHGSEPGAKELLRWTNKSTTSLLNTKDKEGLTPLATAQKEGNTAVADLFAEALGESKKSQ